MSLLDQIRKDTLATRKERTDATKIKFLVTFLDAVAKVGQNDGKRDTTDVEAVAVAKKFGDSAREVAKYGNAEQVATANRELEILASYVPTQLSLEQLSVIIKDQIVASGNGALGPIMKFLKTNYEGKYDGAVAKAAFESLVTLQP